MKRLTLTSIKAVLTASLIFTFSLSAQTTDRNGTGIGQGNVSKGFVDLNNDGINDYAKDADGDGIPNGQDADYDGAKARKGKGARGFVDEDGDGINDNALDSDGDGIPNGRDADFIRPQDGTGRQSKYGAGQGKGQMNNGSGLGTGSGTGTCDGTGPRGTTKQKGRK